MRFRDRVAIVTGASSGIGHHCAIAMAREGATVLGVGRDRARGAALEAVDERIHFRAADLTRDGAPVSVVSEALGEFGRLDVLVNAAAVDHVAELVGVPLADVRAVFETNVVALLAMMQAAVPVMRAGGGGVIVNVTSRLASVGVAQMGVYGASKGAVLALTRAAAIEFAGDGVRVNAVAPGMTRTALYETWLESQPDPAGVSDQVAAAVPQGRIAEPAEVAAAIVFLASSDAAHITGASLPVDGGYTAA